jgi:hypothetical protein
MTRDAPSSDLGGALVSLAAEITQAHKAACGAARSALDHARRAGELLLEAKSHVSHGEWLPWLAEHCSVLSEQQAQRYMRIARRWPEIKAAVKASRVTDMPIRHALALLAEPQVADDADQTFIAVARALAAIRDGRLYRETHATFEAYCRERWGIDAQVVLEILNALERWIEAPR